MTQYLQTRTDLFAAAVSHAGISALSSYWGEGYWGYGYCSVANTGTYPWNNPEFFTKHSPLFNADKIKTPLLLFAWQCRYKCSDWRKYPDVPGIETTRQDSGIYPG